MRGLAALTLLVGALLPPALVQDITLSVQPPKGHTVWMNGRSVQRPDAPTEPSVTTRSAGRKDIRSITNTVNPAKPSDPMAFLLRVNCSAHSCDNGGEAKLVGDVAGMRMQPTFTESSRAQTEDVSRQQRYLPLSKLPPAHHTWQDQHYACRRYLSTLHAALNRTYGRGNHAIQTHSRSGS